MIRVLIADNSPAILGGLSGLLQLYPDFEVVGTARSGPEAAEKARTLLPDVVIMDARMPEVDGVEAIRAIKQASAAVGVLSLSIFADSMEEAVAAGADGFLPKDCDPEQLLSELRQIGARTQQARRREATRQGRSRPVSRRYDVSQRFEKEALP